MRAFDAKECLDQRHAIRRRKEVPRVIRRGRLPARLRLRESLEEPLDRHLKDCRDLRESRRADAVYPFLVFLHLLEREHEPVRQVGLRHAELNPSQAYASAYVIVS
jgi:hypothetical protein